LTPLNEYQGNEPADLLDVQPETPSPYFAAIQRLGNLTRRQVLKQAGHCNQLFVIAILHDTAVLQNQDPVGFDDR
jgi:hypothetical protein